MAVKSCKVDTVRVDSRLDYLHRLSRSYRATELGVNVSRDYGAVGVRIYSGGYAKQNSLRDVSFHSLLADSLELVEVIDHERSDTHVHGIAYISLSFIVSVEINALGREACALCRIQLAARNTVYSHALLCGDTVHFRKAKRL